jgi:K+-sensing histidine kinase KdpD
LPFGFGMREPPRALAYGVAVLATAASLLVRWPLWPVLGDAVPHMTFFPAVVVGAYFGGFWPGLLATILSAVAANYFINEQLRSFHFSVNDLTAAILFVLVGTIVSGLSESLHRARRRIVAHERQRAEAQMELARVNRVTTVGQFTASIAHEVNQPISEVVTMHMPLCAGSTPDRRFWTKRARPSMPSSRKAIEPAKSSAGSAHSSRRCLRGRTRCISTTPSSK